MVLRTCLFVVMFFGVAHADDELARARQLEAQLEYEQALGIVEGILGRGGADPARYAELQLFAGKLAAGLDRAQLAQDHFARALAVKPDAALPAGTSPKLTEPFAAARARTRPLVVRVAVAHGLVTLTADDALGLATGIAVHTLAGGKHADVVEPALRAVVPDGAVVVEVAALDASGNRLWVGAPPPEPAAPVVTHETVRRGVLARWSTWSIVAGVGLAAGGVAAWRLGRAQDDFDTLRQGGHDFSELEAIERRGRRWAVAADVGFGVAAAAGVAAIVFAIRGEDTGVAVGAGSVTVSRRF